MRVLFTTQVGEGHWRPLAPVAQALIDAGHRVAFAASPFACIRLARHGFEAFAIGTDDWMQTPPAKNDALPAPWQEVARDVFLPRAERNLPAMLALCTEWTPDLVVREQTEFAGLLAAEKLGLPHAVIQVSAWRGLAANHILTEPLNRLRADLGLSPDPHLAMLYRHALLLPFPPSFRDPALALPPTAHFVRHVPFDFDHPGDELPAWVAGIDQRPVIYATLGTAYNHDTDLFRMILDAFRDEPISLIVTVGDDQDPASFGPQPPHVHIERYLPQSLVFLHCDLVITHGGSGTVRAALGLALPMVILPIAADQPANARRCADLGLARTIPPEDRSASAIREAALDVLRAPTYRQRAKRMRDEMRALPGPEYAVGLFESLVATHVA